SGGRKGFARLSGRDVSFASPAQVPACDQAALAQRRPVPAEPTAGAAPATPAPPPLPLPRVAAAAAEAAVGAPAGPPPTETQQRSRSCSALAAACSDAGRSRLQSPTGEERRSRRVIWPRQVAPAPSGPLTPPA